MEQDRTFSTQHIAGCKYEGMFAGMRRKAGSLFSGPAFPRSGFDAI